ncbi:hypothetical protein [Acinetobacter indicus]|uniref:hypothetical protein n=1 Tax=Acinetobacter indicus TaxID=756892 RepID=UPI00148DFA3A|nr:hypothetical protein [Acinetobacter indicus]NOJ67242.1 hypothetical protein [Acinetobacter indicus]
MKPCSRQVFNSSSAIQHVLTGPIVAKVEGSVKKLGQKYQNAVIILFNKFTFQPLAIKKPDTNGDYNFLGLNTDLKTFIVAFDQKQQFNAVIQDNVVPK